MSARVEEVVLRGRAAFLRACELDVAVRKPGNVSAASPGHGMDAAHFIAGARAAVGPLFEQGASVGERIEHAVAAACTAAGCNTNLGIVLLCAPLAAAYERRPDVRTVAALRNSLDEVLRRLDVGDARAAYRAIARANPGGLGRVRDHDARSVPGIDLRAAMRLAADRDSIARQYANGYADLFEFGLPLFERTARASADRAMLATFIAYLRRWPDSHVARKHGIAVATSLSREAASHGERYGDDARAADPQAVAGWDRELKARGINPGTSADLTVATAFVFESVRAA